MVLSNSIQTPQKKQEASWEASTELNVDLALATKTEFQCIYMYVSTNTTISDLVILRFSDDMSLI